MRILFLTSLVMVGAIAPLAYSTPKAPTTVASAATSAPATTTTAIGTTSTALAPTTAEDEPTFRTPAKRYGSAYSVKITLRRDGFTYDIPVWVKPDQKESTLDRDQLSELGWVYKDIKPEDISMSGESIDIPNFKNLKTEWAYVPDFPKSCCYGIIGQDLLRKYDLKFDPNPPAHLEWTKRNPDEAPKKTSAKLQQQLAALFSIRTTHGTFGKQKINLATTAYRLSLAKGELSFDPEWVDPKASVKFLKAPLFQYEFTPPKREVLVLSIPGAYQKSAKAFGFKSSVKVTHVNNVLVGSLDHFELDEYLTGRKSKTLVIRTAKTNYTFDFEKNEFTQSEPIQSPPRRN